MRHFLLAATVLLSGCTLDEAMPAFLKPGPPPAAPAEPVAAIGAAPPMALDAAEAAPLAPPRWYAMVVAGNTQQPVFDNFAEDFGALLKAQNVPADVRFAGPGRPPPEEVPIEARSLDAGCLYYLTSHGSPDGFVVNERERDGITTARMLAREVDLVCGVRPTVVVISACYGEAMISPALARDNRVILTAARRDRTSFGCSFTRRHNYFDGCFLKQWDNSTDWRGLYARIQVCIGELEKGETLPSLPQARFGARVSGLLMPPKVP